MEKQDTGKLVCANTKWGNIGQKIFYTLHSSLFFIAPLLYMIFTQTQIRRVLRSRVQTINNTLMEREFNRRHKKVATTLVALTTAFVICWSPFMVTRTLLYYHLASYDLIWTGSQLSVCLNAAVGSFVIRVLRRKPQKFITKTPAVQLLTTATSFVIPLTDIRTNPISKQGNIHVTEKTNWNAINLEKT